MQKTVLTLILVGVVGCQGSDDDLCVPPSIDRDQSGPMGTSSSALMTMNGTVLQGTHTQKISLNGFAEGNGRYLGFSMQDIHLEGTHLMGRTEKEVIGLQVDAITEAGARLAIDIVDGNVDSEDSELHYYVLELDGENICGEGGKGLFLGGIWDERGDYHPSIDIDDREYALSYACTSGVLAKCLRWGYKPWSTDRDYHQACTRMARADYCGDGVSYTEDGTLIDIYDAEEIQTAERTDHNGFHFEAGWGPNGAACVSRPRYDDYAPSGDWVAPHCWERLPKCDGFASAETQGAILGNHSMVVARNLCYAP